MRGKRPRRTKLLLRWGKSNGKDPEGSLSCRVLVKRTDGGLEEKNSSGLRTEERGPFAVMFQDW